MTVRVNWKGVEQMAESAKMQALIKGAADEMAAHIRAQGIKVGTTEGGSGEIDLPVEVHGPDFTDGMRFFDRAQARVSLAHPAGLGVQAKHGVLTKAASEAGLKVRGK